MTDPHTSMSLTAILVLTVVVMVTVVGWLIAVFRAGHQPAGGRARPGSEDPARGEMPARAHVVPSDGQPAAGGGTGEPAADSVGQVG